MTEPVYATRADLYRYGFPRGLVANPGRLCASALASTDTFELDGHGFEDGDAVLLRAESGGELPAPLVAGTTYYVLRQSEATFKLSATPNGSAVNLTTDGASVLVASALPIDEQLAVLSRFVDPFIPAHATPLTEPYPLVVVQIVAKLAAADLLRIAGQSSESMAQLEVGAKAQLERWASGIPLRDARATSSTNRAYSEAYGGDSRGWSNGGTLP